MRLGRLHDRWWLVEADGAALDVTDLVGSGIGDGDHWSDWCARLAAGMEIPVGSDGATAVLEGTAFDAPVVAPSKVVGLLGNDIERADTAAPHAAVDCFLKAPSSVVGPTGEVHLPPDSLVGAEPRVVPECELAVVIGRGGSNIAPADAAGHILGYTIGLDLTLRGGGERSRRKSLPTFCPLGPVLVAADEVEHPDDLAVRLHVGDDLVQDWSTSRMVLSVAETVSWVSSWLPLVPGDVLLTGAPSVTHPLRVGDVMWAEIEHVGELSMRVAS